jgi:hypothetical protein
MLVKSVPNLLLSFLDGGEPVVKTGVLHLLLMIFHGWWMMAHVLIMIAHGMLMEATSKEGHTTSLVATGDLLIRLLLMVVKVTVLPLPA